MNKEKTEPNTEKAEIGTKEKEREREKNLPHKIFGMIVEEYPEGISVEEIETVLGYVLFLAKHTQLRLN